MRQACGSSRLRADQRSVPGSPSHIQPGRQTEYERYMRTSVLLGLQPPEDAVAHPDEILFVGVHQVHELVLKLASRELVDAAAQLCTTSGRTQVSLPVARAIRLVGLLSETLAVLEDMPPNAFAAIRPSLGNGSGAQSPGWRSLRLAARVCGRALRIAGAHRQDAELHVVANGLRTLDERVADWRRRHYAVAERLLGTDGVGTAGTPVPVLARTVDQHLLPMLWQQPAQAATGGAR